MVSPQMTDIDQSAVYEKYMGLALRFVSYRPRSQQEILQYLEKSFRKHHTTAPRVLNKIMERLAQLGYVNDRAFAVWWVSQRTGQKPKGPQVIRNELLKKGIGRELIEEVVSARLSEGGASERELAAAAARRRLPRLKRYPMVERRAKLGNYLLRRGFGAELVWSVVDEVTATV